MPKKSLKGNRSAQRQYMKRHAGAMVHRKEYGHRVETPKSIYDRNKENKPILEEYTDEDEDFDVAESCCYSVFGDCNWPDCDCGERE